jgi:hypothetical protein
VFKYKISNLHLNSPSILKNAGFCAAAQELQLQGWALVGANVVRKVFAFDNARVGIQSEFTASWDNLPRDPHLADGGCYRFRRHASLLQTFSLTAPCLPASLTQVPYRPHWQPLTYNKLHGGRFRHFAPITDEVAASPIYMRLLSGLGQLFCALKPTRQWYVEAHQFRIDASQGTGLPTPEGAHRDGVDFVALLLIRRGTLSGGTTSIHTLEGETLIKTTLSEPLTLMLLDDNRVAHATTPIEAEGTTPVRDTLVLTYRSSGFLEP